MKKHLLFSLALLAGTSLLAADTSPKDEIASAAAALGNQATYAWHTTVETGNGSAFRPGPTDGKTEKDGYTTIMLSFNDNSIEVVMHGTNAAVKTPDDGWQSAAEVLETGGGGFNPARFAAYMTSGFKAPAEQAASLVTQVKDLAAGTNGISGELTEDGAKQLLAFRRRGNGDGPSVSSAKGSATFWLADGKLVKYQTHVSGTISFNGNDRDVDRTTTTEIKDVGTTKVEVSDDAKKKLE